MKKCLTIKALYFAGTILILGVMKPATAQGVERIHLFLGAGTGLQSLYYTNSGIEIRRDSKFILNLVGQGEVTVIHKMVDARLGFLLESVQGSNEIMEETRLVSYGAYGKVQLAFAYGGWGWQHIGLHPIEPDPAPNNLERWLPFQILGVEFKLIKFSLNFEYQHTGGKFAQDSPDFPQYGYRKHSVRILIGFHL